MDTYTPFFVWRETNVHQTFKQRLEINPGLAEEDLFSSPARFFITAPRQHLRLAAPTFCSHYIWIKAIEWIDTSALASGRALKWRRTKRLFCLCPPRGETRRWSNLQLSPLIIRAVPAEKWRSRSAPCGVHPHRAPTAMTPRCAFTDDSPCDTEVSEFPPVERDRPRPQPRLNGALACFDGDDGRSVWLEIWSRK